MWAAVINTLIGIWIMVSPGLLHFDKNAANNHYVVGPLIITIAIAAIWEVNRSIRYFNLLAGLWLVISPFMISYQQQDAIWISVISGLLIAMFSLIQGKIAHQYGGGWRILFESNRKFFQDKVIVITGATGGVGRVAAWAFAKQGAKVALIARDPSQLEGTKKEIEVYGGEALSIMADVADAEQLEEAIAKIEEHFGAIDVLVNNAMNSVFAPFHNITPGEFKRVTDVTYLGTVYCTMSVLKRMRNRNKGAIIFVGSALAYRGIPLQSAYCGSKHAIQGFYDSLRTELMHDKLNIKTCMVQLPAMNTTQFDWVLNKLPNKGRPMGKVYMPEVAARAIVFAAKHNRREILVGFPSYQAIIGNKIAPWYADWVLSRKGYKGQQTTEPVDPDRKNNLWNAVAEDRGAYGNFGDEATNKSFTLWIAMNRNLVRLTVLIAIIVLLSYFIF
ncbi:MAG TPA: SDR family oxidoreductase [Ohtaekwangia sp.]|nr:SDR family oxidoreductase [Ohtaekwangia sp.]